jgi:hypothetical protein
MTNGLVVMTPSSVDKTGASSTATINADGSVTFGSCATLSLNGVFTGDYDNYMVTIRHKHDTLTSAANHIRFRDNGIDNNTTNSYTYQLLAVGGTSITVERRTGNYAYYDASSNVRRDGTTLYIFGPALAQPTAFRPVTVQGFDAARIYTWAGTHNQSVSYDGFTITADNNSGTTISGLLTVFGFNQ